jgi:hypothetical protein
MSNFTKLQEMIVEQKVKPTIISNLRKISKQQTAVTNDDNSVNLHIKRVKTKK